MRIEPKPTAVDLPPIVLILDANADTWDVYETTLKVGGMWASWVVDPNEAFTYAEDIRPDAILADVDTGEAGQVFTLAERLRSDLRTAGIPILGIAGHEPPDVSPPAGLFDAVLQKPLELPMLVERIREAIGRGAALRAQGERARTKVADLMERSEHVIGRSMGATEHTGRVMGGFPRPCPRCAGELQWVERRQITGVVFDYYRPCSRGCGLFCYDHAQRAFVTLVG